MPDSCFYDRMAITAARQIERRGRAIIVNHSTDAPLADPNAPWDRSPAQITNFPTFGVFSAFERKEVDGTNIKATDLKLLIAAITVDCNDDVTQMPFELSTRDTITDSKYGNLTVIDYDMIEPGEVSILYTVQVRRG